MPKDTRIPSFISVQSRAEGPHKKLPQVERENIDIWIESISKTINQMAKLLISKRFRLTKPTIKEPFTNKIIDFKVKVFKHATCLSLPY